MVQYLSFNINEGKKKRKNKYTYNIMVVIHPSSSLTITKLIYKT